jgi:hypothetical protein
MTTGFVEMFTRGGRKFVDNRVDPFRPRRLPFLLPEGAVGNTTDAGDLSPASAP